MLPPCPLHKSYGCGRRGRIGGGWLVKGGFSGRRFLRQKTFHQLASKVNHPLYPMHPSPSEYAPPTPHPTTASLCNWRTVYPQTKTCNLSPDWQCNWLLISWNSWYMIGCRKWWLTNIQSVEIYTAGEICRFDWGSSPPEVQPHCGASYSHAHKHYCAVEHYRFFVSCTKTNAQTHSRW